MLTFTLPAELRGLAFANQQFVYDQLLRCSWDTVRQFAETDPKLHGMPGAISVLHTHTRRLDYHPHVHLVMPAAALNAEQQVWRSKTSATDKVSYLFNHKALAKVFRAQLNLAGIVQKRGESTEIAAWASAMPPIAAGARRKSAHSA